MAPAKAARALEKLARFQLYISGHEFSFADCAAYAHLPVVSIASRALPGVDALGPVAGIAGYMKIIATHPHPQRVDLERKAGLEPFAASRQRD